MSLPQQEEPLKVRVGGGTESLQMLVKEMIIKKMATMEMTAEQLAHMNEILAKFPDSPTPSIEWNPRFDYMKYSLVDQTTKKELVSNEISVLMALDKNEMVGVELRGVHIFVDSLLQDKEMLALLLARAEKLGIDLAHPVKGTKETSGT